MATSTTPAVDNIAVTNGAEKKRKKDKSRSKQARNDEVIVENDTAMDVDESVDVDVEAPRPKKKKRTAEAESSDSPMADVVTTSEFIPEKKEKKHKKRRKHDSDAALPLDATSTVGLDAAPDAQENGAESEAPKKKKSKKSKHTDDTSATATADVPAPAETEASSSKAEKKEKKHKSKKDKTQDPTAALSTTPTSSTSSAPSQSEIDTYLSTHHISLSLPDSCPPSSAIPILSFSSLLPLLPSSLHSVLSAFKDPTPIQACSWGPALAGKDVVGIAETGSGKTLAFGIPALASLLSSSSSSSKKSKKSGANAGASEIQVLVLAPTRELAIQTHDTLSSALLTSSSGLTSVAVFGGVDKHAQICSLRSPGARIVVGTPGRVQDLMQDGSLDISGVKYLVLDEADRMLDKGFENDIRRIVGETPSEGRQTLMFSATWPESVRRLASTFQVDPIRITVGTEDLTANKRITQVLEVFDDPFSKDRRLLAHLKRLKHPKTPKPGPESEENARMIVFVLYKNEAPRVEGLLRREGYSVMALQGDMSQSGRMEALKAFKEGVTNTLVATDVAARGLDIPNVSTVFNYTFPLTIEDYVHRIGRTGRGGRTGTSITFFTGEKQEKALAGELARFLQDGGFEDQCEELKKRFPMTIKKKVHAVYGAHFRDDVDMTKKPTKIKF